MPIRAKITVALLDEADLRLWYWACERCQRARYHWTHAEAIHVGLEHLEAGCPPRLKAVS